MDKAPLKNQAHNNQFLTTSHNTTKIASKTGKFLEILWPSDLSKYSQAGRVVNLFKPFGAVIAVMPS